MTDDPLKELLLRIAAGYRLRPADVAALPIRPGAEAAVRERITRTARTLGALRCAGRYADARRLARGVACDLQHHIDAVGAAVPNGRTGQWGTSP